MIEHLNNPNCTSKLGIENHLNSLWEWSFPDIEDMALSFLRGVTDRGAVDMRPTYVATKYLRSAQELDV